jgi:secretion/DNA translocation related TadE-like protein
VQRDEGSGTLAAAAAGIVLVCAAILVVAAAELSLARHRLAGIADLTALGAAQAYGAECERAHEIAQGNNVLLQSCRTDDLDVHVEVSAPIPAVTTHLLTFLGQPGRTFSAQARAGW